MTSRSTTDGTDGATGSRDSATPAIAVDDATVTYDDGTTAVEDLSLRVDGGELFGLLGPNGAGKTTTMRLLTGRAVPDEGELSVLGIDPVGNGPAVRERVGILPESADPHSFQTPREYLRFVGLSRDMDDAVVDDRIHEWADRLRFGEKLDALGTDLSQGQAAKVTIAAAFLHEPDLVLLDEPLANLDPIARGRVREHLVDYAEAGNTAFLSTHEIEVAESICTSVGVLDAGELVAVRDTGSMDDRGLIETFEEAVAVPTGTPGRRG